MHFGRHLRAVRGLRRGALRLRIAPVALAALVTLTIVVASTSPASAYCSGLSCLPRSGYTLDETYNCGFIDYGEICFYPGWLNRDGPHHTWGFGSATYNGAGDADVYVASKFDSGTTAFFGHGTNLARACYEGNCNDQNSAFINHVVYPLTRHTVIGHGLG